MGRTMPTECEHGNVIDWGDFGPHPDGCPGMDGDYRQDPYCVGCFPVCPKCERDDAARTGLTVECDVCGDELADPGALIFSPPQTIRGQDMTFPAMTQKFHICFGCWTDEVQHVVMPNPPNNHTGSENSGVDVAGLIYSPEQLEEYARSVLDHHDPEQQDSNGYERCAECHYTRHPCEVFEMASAVLTLLATERR